jgi:flagellar basal body-associated protein FliL
LIFLLFQSILDALPTDEIYPVERNDELIYSEIPPEYRPAYEELYAGKVDELFYRMMQLGRGISKGDRVALNCASYRLLRNVTTDAYSILFIELPLGEKTKQAIILLNNVPLEFVDDSGVLGMLILGRYESTNNEIPIIIADYILYPKIIIAKSQQSIQTLPAESISKIEEVITFSLSSQNTNISPPLSYYDGVESFRGKTIDIPPATFLIEVSIGYTLNDARTLEALQANKPKIIELMLRYFSRKSASELGPAYYDLIQSDLRTLLNNSISSVSIKSVVFRQISVFKL